MTRLIRPSSATSPFSNIALGCHAVDWLSIENRASSRQKVSRSDHLQITLRLRLYVTNVTTDLTIHVGQMSRDVLSKIISRLCHVVCRGQAFVAFHLFAPLLAAVALPVLRAKPEKPSCPHPRHKVAGAEWVIPFVPSHRVGPFGNRRMYRICSFDVHLMLPDVCSLMAQPKCVKKMLQIWSVELWCLCLCLWDGVSSHGMGWDGHPTGWDGPKVTLTHSGLEG